MKSVGIHEFEFNKDALVMRMIRRNDYAPELWPLNNFVVIGDTKTIEFRYQFTSSTIQDKVFIPVDPYATRWIIVIEKPSS